MASEDPEKFKDVIMPILRKIQQNDPKRRGGNQRDWSPRRSDSSAGGNRTERSSDRRVIDL